MSTGAVTAAGPIRALVAALRDGGVTDAVICPGSRSTPIALALRVAPGLRCWVQIDERAAGFFALGIAKASRRPVAIAATSGTAVVNFAPAVAEARYGRVPLIVLSADRPPELQGIGAPQTIAQHDLYGRHAKWFAALPVPEPGEDQERMAYELGREAMQSATRDPAGPVQLDLPYREPLLPAGTLAADGPTGETRQAERSPGAGYALPRSIVEQVRRAGRGLLVCGPLDVPGFADAIARLGVTCGFPILADGLSNVRSGPHDRSAVIAHHDLLLRAGTSMFQRTPDLVIRFGGRPTSKALDQWLDGLAVPQLLVDDGGGWERSRTPTLVHADPVAFVKALVKDREDVAVAIDDTWLAGWRSADQAVAASLRRWRSTLDEPFEGSVPAALEEALPAGTVVLVANSMPVRDLETFAPSSPGVRRYLGNRGVNGIDGLLSTAFGLAAGQSEPVVAVVGDLAFLHDLNALAAAGRLGISATIVLVDNDGGGIFSFLPQASADRPELGLPEHYEELFGTPHGIDLGPVCTALGASHRDVAAGSLVAALRDAVAESGVSVVHVRTDRDRNVALHRAAETVVGAALAEVA